MDWSRRALAAIAVACTAGCSGAVDLDLDTRARPCTGVTVAGQPGVTWFTPASSEYRRELDAWCATVGTPVVHQPLTSAIAAPPHPISPVPRIVLVSWNVHVGGGDIAKLVRDLRSGRLTTGEALPFVLLLQEAFRMRDDVPALGNKQPAAPRISPRPPSGRRVSTPDLAKQLDLHAFYVPSMRNGRGSADDREDRGCAILSTLPLNDLHAIELPFERQRRVALAARIDDVAGEDDLWLVDVHLENRTGARRAWLESPAARARQARALLKKFLPDGPAVLGGDLNTWASNEPTIEMLKDVFDTPVGDDLRETLPRVGRIDYLLARLPSGWAMTSRRLDSRYGSDHYPVLGVLTLPQSTLRN